MFGQLKAAYRAFRATRKIHQIQARWDASRTSTNNSRLWAGSDSLSINAAASPDVRKILRQRSRYECQENNSYGKGFVLSLADFTIGRGARLRSQTGDANLDSLIETEFNAWLKTIGAAEKLRTMKMAKTVDGETFAMEINNPRLPTPVQLDYRILESEQCQSIEGDYVQDENRHVDGIWYDMAGNPEYYDIMLRHPGGNGGEWETTPISADRIIHLYRVDRPGQKRGIPETAPALNLFPILRQYTMATLEAATSAAYWMAVIHSRLPADQMPAQIANGPFDVFDLERNAVMNLPDGWDISQLKPEHPTTTYSEFKKEVLSEIARCLSVPFNVAAGNSSDYNFASGRLDWQIFFRNIEVERSYFERECLSRWFYKWLAEAKMVQDYLPLLPDRIKHSWLWDGQPLIDPVKEANAVVTLFNAGLLDEDDYWAGRGTDTDDVYLRTAENLKRRTELGLPLPGGGMNQEQDDEEDDEESEGKQEKRSEPAGSRSSR